MPRSPFYFPQRVESYTGLYGETYTFWIRRESYLTDVIVFLDRDPTLPPSEDETFLWPSGFVLPGDRIGMWSAFGRKRAIKRAIFKSNIYLNKGKSHGQVDRSP